MNFIGKLRMAAVFVLALAMMGIDASCRTPAGRTTGNVVDDATITTKVKSKILAQEKLKGFGISVETFQGDVTLTGAVDTLAEKQQAEQIAMSVDGVKNVNNLLQVKKNTDGTSSSASPGEVSPSPADSHEPSATPASSQE